MDARTLDIDGPVHYLDYPGPEEGPTFVCVHGLGGSHANWLALAPLLALRGRVLVPDLAGFGRTPLQGRSASVQANRMLLDRFITRTLTAPVVLVGNSMGGAISIMQAYTDPESVAGLVLVDPAAPRAANTPLDAVVAARFATYMVPKMGEVFIRRRLRAMGPEGVALETLALCTVDPARVPRDVVDAQLALARERYETMPWATTAFLQAARSLVRLLARRDRFFAMVRALAAPALVIAGRRDRLVPVGAIRNLARLRPDWELVVFDDLGHVPQMEDAPATADAIGGWLDGPGARIFVARRPAAGD